MPEPNAMQTTYTYAVIAADNACVCVRANRLQAIECLKHWRQSQPGGRYALVLETCTPSGRCTEEFIINFYQPLEN